MDDFAVCIEAPEQQQQPATPDQSQNNIEQRQQFDEDQEDQTPPPMDKNVLIRDVLLRFIHAAFPGAQLQMPPQDDNDDDQQQQQQQDIDLDMIASGVTELADLLRDEKKPQQQQPTESTTPEQQRVAIESVQANQDLLAMCQKMLVRLQNSHDAFAPSRAKQRRRKKQQQPDHTSAAAPPTDSGLDLDFLLGAKQQQHEQEREEEEEDADDVISAMRCRIEQLEEERESLLESCSVLTLQLRNARSTVDNATRKFEEQCFRTFEELTRVHIAVESLREAPVATNVAAVGTSSSSVTEADFPQQQQHHDTPVAKRSSLPLHHQHRPDSATTTATTPGERRQSAGTAADDSHVDSQSCATASLEPLDRIYLQSYPALGMGMVLQTLAVVFKHEYDVMMMGDAGIGPIAAAGPATDSRGASQERSSSPDEQDDDAAHFENACRQFQMSLQKDLGPLLGSLSTLQHQMGLLSSSGASVRGDYVSKCLQARIKPNSGVMKALTAVASTDRRRIRALDLSNFLVGDHGLAPLTATIESLYRLKRLDLRSNNLHAAGVRTLCAMLRRHPCVAEVDLRGNPVGRAGAKLLLGLIAECPRVEKIVIDDRAVETSLLSRISNRLAENHPPVEVAAE